MSGLTNIGLTGLKSGCGQSCSPFWRLGGWGISSGESLSWPFPPWLVVSLSIVEATRERQGGLSPSSEPVFCHIHLWMLLVCLPPLLWLHWGPTNTILPKTDQKACCEMSWVLADQYFVNTQSSGISERLPSAGQHAEMLRPDHEREVSAATILICSTQGFPEVQDSYCWGWNSPRQAGILGHPRHGLCHEEFITPWGSWTNGSEADFMSCQTCFEGKRKGTGTEMDKTVAPLPLGAPLLGNIDCSPNSGSSLHTLFCLNLKTASGNEDSYRLHSAGGDRKRTNWPNITKPLS